MKRYRRDRPEDDELIEKRNPHSGALVSRRMQRQEVTFAARNQRRHRKAWDGMTTRSGGCRDRAHDADAKRVEYGFQAVIESQDGGFVVSAVILENTR